MICKTDVKHPDRLLISLLVVISLLVFCNSKAECSNNLEPLITEGAYYYPNSIKYRYHEGKISSGTVDTKLPVNGNTQHITYRIYCPSSEWIILRGSVYSNKGYMLKSFTQSDLSSALREGKVWPGSNLGKLYEVICGKKPKSPLPPMKIKLPKGL